MCVDLCNVLASSWCGSPLISPAYESNSSQALTPVPYEDLLLLPTVCDERWVRDWCTKTIKQFHVVNHLTIHTSFQYISSHTTRYNYIIDKLRALTVDVCQWRVDVHGCFLKGSSDTSGGVRSALRRTQPVENRDKTWIILLSRIQKLTVSTLNGGQCLPPLTQ